MPAKRQSPAASAKVLSTGLALAATFSITALLGQHDRVTLAQAASVQPSSSAALASAQLGTVPPVTHTLPTASTIAPVLTVPIATPGTYDTAPVAPLATLPPVTTPVPVTTIKAPSPVVIQVPVATYPPAPSSSGSR